MRPGPSDSLRRMLSFRELTDALPQISADVPIAELSEGVSRPDSRDPAFIEPSLTVREGDPRFAKAILVAAPAAVGKSMFARALAVDRRALLWNLGEFPVGDGTFLGKLTEAHGIKALADVTDSISSGDYCAVLDALDEGYSLARSDNFAAFVSDLAKQVAALGPPRPAVITCGRTETVDLAALLLEESGLEVCVMTLNFFSRDEAREFVDVHLDRAGHTAHRQYSAPYEHARNALFERVEEAVRTDEVAGGIDAPSFLGYAPVLIALARYLKVGNYQAFEVPGAGEGVWGFLREILVDLLRREQPILVEKLPADVREAIPTDRLAQLYLPEEQCARLLARAAGAPAPKVDLPAVALPRYEEAVAGTLGEHPFVGTGPEGFASVVFRDYVLAGALAQGGDGADMARGLAEGRAFKPSPLLVRFFVQIIGEKPSAAIDPRALSILYASAHAEEAGDARASLTVEQADEGLDAEIITAGGDLLEFQIAPAPDERLPVGHRLARSDIHVPDWTVVFGPGGSEAVVGPDVTIAADGIAVTAASLRIEARSEEEVVTWRVRQVEHEAGEFRLVGADRGGFRLVVAEQPIYPWTGYAVDDETDADGHEAEIDDAVRELKKLTTRFKPGPVSEKAPALPVKIMDVLVARGRVAPDLYEYAVETGLITVEGKVCLLHPQQFGMNVVDLRERRITAEVEEYLSGYLRSRGQ